MPLQRLQQDLHPQPNPRRTSEATKEAVQRALAQRLWVRAIARCLKVSYQTIQKVAHDAQKNTSHFPKG